MSQNLTPKSKVLMADWEANGGTKQGCAKAVKDLFKCPKCGTSLDTTDLAKALAAKGGRAGRGHAKARSTEQARAAAKVRWDRVKERKQKDERDR